MIFLSQVNGIDTVRIPVSLVPHEDQSAKYKKLLKLQRRARANASEPDTTTVSEDEVVDPSSEGSRSASGATAENRQTSEEITTPSNESSKQD